MYIPRDYVTETVESAPEFEVTYNPGSYAGATVYLHAAGESMWTGERIGVLGGMVGHGAYAQMGEPVHDAVAPFIPQENSRGWWVARITRSQAAQRMATEHLAAKSAA